MTVQQAAALAKLEVSPAEAERMEEEFAQILAYFQQMNIDEGGAPVCYTEGHLRADEPRPCLARDSLLGLAPECKDEYISVPKSFE